MQLLLTKNIYLTFCFSPYFFLMHFNPKSQNNKGVRRSWWWREMHARDYVLIHKLKKTILPQNLYNTPPLRARCLRPGGQVLVSIDAQYSIGAPFVSISQFPYSCRNVWVLQFETIGTSFSRRSSSLVIQKCYNSYRRRKTLFLQCQ